MIYFDDFGNYGDADFFVLVFNKTRQALTELALEVNRIRDDEYFRKAVGQIHFARKPIIF